MYSYELDVNAKSQQEALVQAKKYYENINYENADGYIGVADGNSFEKVKFNILKD